MLSVFIGREYTTIQNVRRKAQWRLKTNDAFGDLFGKLRDQFPDFNYTSSGDTIASEIIMALHDNGSPKYLFHCREYGASLFFAESVTHGKLSLQLSIQDVDQLRTDYNMTSTYCFDLYNGEQRMVFNRLNTITEVLISLLYYYAYSGLKLNVCRHCGKWFATSTLKEVYCSRTSPCSRDILREDKSCKDAVHDIKQMQSRRRTNLYRYLYFNGDCEDFSEECNKHKANIKNAPTVDNFRNYQSYLYSEDFPKRIAKENRHEST